MRECAAVNVSRLGLNPALPDKRVTARMEARDDEDAFGLNAEEQTVWKAPQSGPSHVCQHLGKVFGSRADPCDLDVNFAKELCAKPWGLSLVPSMRVDHVQPGGWHEDDAARQEARAASSALRLSQVTACDLS